MHIAIDARIISSSTGTYVKQLLSHLEKIDQKNNYSILVPSKDLTYWVPKSPRMSLVACDIKNYSFQEQTLLKTQLETLQPDLVHFCMPQQPVSYKGKKVTTVHDLTLLHTYNSDKNWLIFRLKQLVGRWVFKKIARTNHSIITPSEFTKRAYAQFSGIDPARITVTHEAALKSVEKIEPYDVPFSRFILYVGQQSDYKNIPRLAKAHQQLLKQYPDLGLVLVGSLNQSAQKNKALFEKNGYKNVHFTGFIPDSQRDWLYKHAAVYAFPSLMEGFGLPGLEAMAQGAPVASSHATCLPEIYGSAAHYFDPTDVNDIARALSEVISDNTLRDSLIQKGSAQLERYSWERMARQTLEVYERALMNSPVK